MPEYAFLMSENTADLQHPNPLGDNLQTPCSSTSQATPSTLSASTIEKTPTKVSVSIIENPLPGPSCQNDEPQDCTPLNDDITPGKILAKIISFPIAKVHEVRKRSRQVAAVMTSPEFLTEKRSKLQKKNYKKPKKQNKEKSNKGLPK